MQSTATLAVRLTQSTAIPHAPAQQALSPTGLIPASNKRRFLIGGFDLLADARGCKGQKGYKRRKPRGDGRERLKKSRVVIVPQCEPDKLSAPVPKCNASVYFVHKSYVNSPSPCPLRLSALRRCSRKLRHTIPNSEWQLRDRPASATSMR